MDVWWNSLTLFRTLAVCVQTRQSEYTHVEVVPVERRCRSGSNIATTVHRTDCDWRKRCGKEMLCANGLREREREWLQKYSPVPIVMQLAYIENHDSEKLKLLKISTV